jgi:hypothetical protein
MQGKITFVFIALAFCALAFCACASSGSVDTAQVSPMIGDDYWLALPGPASVVIIGITGRQQKRENEIELAREYDDKKAAMYHGVQVNFENIQDIGANFFDYFTSSEIELD